MGADEYNERPVIFSLFLFCLRQVGRYTSGNEESQAMPEHLFVCLKQTLCFECQEPPPPHRRRAAPSCTSHKAFLNGFTGLVSSRALERLLNHRSTTSIRGDMSTRYTQSSGITVRSLHGQPSAQKTLPRSSQHHCRRGTRAHTLVTTFTRRTSSARYSCLARRPRQ